MEISRILPSKPIKNWNSKFIANSDGFQYEQLSLTTTNATVWYGYNNTMVSMAKTSGANQSWNAQVYSNTGWAAPVTLEFVKVFPATDSGLDYTMISLNTDPATDPNYTSLDWAMYPYSSTCVIYNNGSAITPGTTISAANRFYIVYASDGFIYHYNGSSLVYSVNTTSSTTLRYLDTSFWGTGNSFTNVRIIRRRWNGQTYV